MLMKKLKTCFTSVPFVAFRTARHLGNFLVRAKVYPRREKKVHANVVRKDVPHA